MRQRIGSSVLALLAFFMALEATAQVNVSKGGDDWAARLQQQGWQQTAPGVFQRQSASGQSETLAIGREGLERALQELQHRFTTLRETYRTSPSADLEKALIHLRDQIAELEKTVSEQGAEVPSTLPSGCNFAFGCSAYAAPLSSSQGVTASSSSYFYNDCSYQATVYADANGYTNIGSAFQANYPSGSNLSTSASISVPGGPSCFSDAVSYVNSSSLGLYYSCYQSNSSCPAQPLDVSVSGPSHVYVNGYDCTTAYYSASASGGTPPYSYSWSTDYGSGSGSSFSITFCGGDYNYTEYVYVSVTATDSASGSDSASMTTTVHYQANCPYYLNSQDRPFCYDQY